MAFVVLLATRDQGTDIYSFQLKGKPAPSIAGDGIRGGGFDLASRSGRWVVVNFLPRTAATCITEHPELVEFRRHKAMSDANVVSVGVRQGTPTGTGLLHRTGRRLAGCWPSDDGRISNDYGVVKLPKVSWWTPTAPCRPSSSAE